ncbi:hypothetical protein [Streptomyces mirabilis]|uniref:hypothetical protein n=1 Tax=Streptomyces mirabilis TaxID=68239 RepID=UPI002258F284|nr:hypothetical protein [Streptomyces mirabilis]MCX4426455.1 hypothetical protein [Streptomyces mirabilis]
MQRLHEVTEQPAPALPSPTAQEFRGLLRSVLEWALTRQRGFSAAIATAIARDALPPPQECP